MNSKVCRIHSFYIVLSYQNKRIYSVTQSISKAGYSYYNAPIEMYLTD